MSDQLNENNEQLAIMNERLASIIGALESMTAAQKDYTKAIKDSTDAIEDQTDEIEASSTAEDNYKQSKEKTTKEEEKRERALRKAGEVLDSFIGATLSVEKGMTKYSGAITSAIDGIAKGVISFIGPASPLSLAVAGFAITLGALIKGALEMNQATLGAKDQLVKFGGAGAFTAEEFKNLAAQAKISYQELSVFVKPMQKLGPSLLTLGDTAGAGMKKFMETASYLSDKQIGEFRKLGLTYDEQIEIMSEYVNLQALSGINISRQNLSTSQLLKYQTEYTKNLVELSALTGVDVDTARQRQQAAANQAELQLRNIRMQGEETRLRKMAQAAEDANNTEQARLYREEADQIKTRIKNERAFMDTISIIGDPKLTAAFTEFFRASGGILSDIGAPLSLLGTDLADLYDRFEGSDMDPYKLLDEVFGKIGVAAESGIGAVAGIADSSVRDLFLFTQTLLPFVSAHLARVEQGAGSVDSLRQMVEDMAKTNKDGVATTQALNEQLDRASKSLAQDFYSTINGPLLASMRFLSDAARSAARWLSLFTIEGRERRRVEDERERESAARRTREELSSSISERVISRTTDDEDTVAKLLPQESEEERNKRLYDLEIQARLVAAQEEYDRISKTPTTKRKGSAAVRQTYRREREQQLENLENSIRDLTVLSGKPETDQVNPTGTDSRTPETQESVSTRRRQQVDNAIKTPRTASSPASAAPETKNQPEPDQATASAAVAPAPASPVSSSKPRDINDDVVKAFIKRNEGIKYKPYKDADGFSVGIGHYIGSTLPEDMNRRFTEKEINDLFEKDYAIHKQVAERFPNYDKLDANGKTALIDLAFNLGESKLGGFVKAKAAAENKDMNKLISELIASDWYNQVGDRSKRVIDLLKDSEFIQARDGGIAQGPDSGYMTTLHGNELIQPIDTNSILAKLATTPESQTNNTLMNSQIVTQTENKLTDLYRINEQLIYTLNHKLDEMITKIIDGNDTRTQILRYSMV
jgi:lysozyme